MTDSLTDNTRALAALLDGRADWRFEAFDDEDHWLFGVDGGAAGHHAGDARLPDVPERSGR